MSSSMSLALNISLSPANRRAVAKDPVNWAVAPRACLGEVVSSPGLSNDLSISQTKTAQIIADEKKFLVGTYARSPVVFARGKGCKLYDIEGREYLDLTAGIAVNSLGHCDPDVVATIKEQVELLTHVGNVFHTEPPVVLAKRLISSSFADRVFFCNSGTEANEGAIKFSRKFQRKSHPDIQDPPVNFIAFSNCFHGRTMGAVALTSKEHYRLPFDPVMPGVTFCEYGDTKSTVDLIQTGKFAAVFVEPVQGEGGILGATKSFLQSLRAACDESGCVLVFDEVQCGLGRTGHLWAHNAYDVYPDIMTVAKPLAAGLPIGAILTTERIAAAIDPGDHGSTFAGNPLVCSTAITVFDKISNPSFLTSVSEKGQYFKQLLAQKFKGNSHVKEIRGFGLLIGIELDVPASPLVSACLQSGLLVLTAGKGNVIRIVPPLIISKEELEQAAEILVSCLPALDAPSNS